MSTLVGKRQKVRDLNPVVPLELPKNTIDLPLDEIIDEGIKLLRKFTLDGLVTMCVPKVEFQDLGLDVDIVGYVKWNPIVAENLTFHVALIGRFRYGREEDEVLGMSLCREVYLGHKLLQEKNQKFPSSVEVQSGQSQPSTGDDVETEAGAPIQKYSFHFVLPADAPISTVMQPVFPDSGDTCGVRYFVRCYTVEDMPDRTTKTSSVLNICIRKVQWGPLPDPLPQPPKGSIFKEFPLNGGRVALEATLNKPIYEHGEEIRIKINLMNSSHKSIKHVKVAVQQSAQINLFSTGKWKVCVASADSRTNCHTSRAHCTEQEVVLIPKAVDNKNKYGVFVQSTEFGDEPCLASTTLMSEEERQNYFGILIDYEVKIKLCLAALSSLSGFKTWVCNGVKGLVEEKGSPVSSPTKVPSTPAERRGEVACFIPFQIMQLGPSKSASKTTTSLETGVKEITLKE